MSSGNRITRSSQAAAEDLASLSSRECLLFSQAVYEYGAKQSAWRSKSTRLNSSHSGESRMPSSA